MGSINDGQAPEVFGNLPVDTFTHGSPNVHEGDVLSGAVPGTPIANKVLVLGGDGSINFPSGTDLKYKGSSVLAGPGTVTPVTAGATTPFNDAVLSYGINSVLSQGTSRGVQLPTPFVNAVCVVYDSAGAGMHISTSGPTIDISYDAVTDISVAPAASYGNTFMFIGLSATRWLLVTGALG